MQHRFLESSFISLVLLSACGGSSSGSTTTPVPGGHSTTPAKSDKADEKSASAEEHWVGDCLHCGDVIDYHGNPKLLCEDSARYYAPFQECACTGVCASICADSYCAGKDTGVDC